MERLVIEACARPIKICLFTSMGESRVTSLPLLRLLHPIGRSGKRDDITTLRRCIINRIIMNVNVQHKKFKRATPAKKNFFSLPSVGTYFNALMRLLMEAICCDTSAHRRSYLFSVFFVVCGAVLVGHGQSGDGGRRIVEEPRRVRAGVAVALDLAQESLQVLHVQRFLLQLLRQVDDFLAVPREAQLDVLDPRLAEVRLGELLLLQ